MLSLVFHFSLSLSSFCLVLLPLFNLFCVSCVCVRVRASKGLSFRRVYSPLVHTHTQLHKGFSHFRSPPPLFLFILLLCDLFLLAWISCSSFVRFTFNGFSPFLRYFLANTFLSFDRIFIRCTRTSHTHMNANLHFFISLISYRFFSFLRLKGLYALLLPGDFPFCCFFLFFFFLFFTINTIR